MLTTDTRYKLAKTNNGSVTVAFFSLWNKSVQQCRCSQKCTWSIY